MKADVGDITSLRMTALADSSLFDVLSANNITPPNPLVRGEFN
jgi:hypothetical protein